MLKFGEFIVEGGYGVPVVSISKDKVDLSKADTRNEINRLIASELSRSWMNPYGGWKKIERVLEMYSIELPRIVFHDEDEGEEVVAIQQFGDKWGATLDGQVTSPSGSDDAEYFLYYSYGIAEHGFYDCYAVVTDEEGLDDLISDDTEIDDEEGEKDPRQP